MSVDKFGRFHESLGGGKLYSRSQFGIGLQLTSDGDYDVQLKRLRYLKDPSDDGDAVNLGTLVKTVDTCLRLREGTYDAGYCRLGNVEDPVEDCDAVTKRYLSTVVPSKVLDGYSLKGAQLKDVAFPTLETDAVNLQYIVDNCVTFDFGAVNAKNNIVSNVANGIMVTDAATVGQALTVFEGNWDGRSMKICNIAEPTGQDDVVTLGYVKDKLPAAGVDNWLFNNKRLSQVNDPIYEKEVVNLRTLHSHTVSKQFPTDAHFSAKGLMITDLNDGLGDMDAANVRMVKRLYNKLNENTEEKIVRLGAQLMHHVHGGRSAAEVTLPWDYILLKKDTL